MSGARALALLALFTSAGALAALILLIEPSGSSGSAEPATLTGVARDPESVRGRTVTITRAGAAAGLVATEVERADATAHSTAPLRSFSRTTVREVIRHPQRYRNSLLAVSGRAYRLSRYFVLLDDGRAIFVGASPDDLRAVDRGERLRVRAEIGRMSRFRAETAARALSSHRGARRSRRSARIDRTPSKRGSPYLVLRELRGGGTARTPG